MTFPQSTLEEIIESERLMLLTAEQRYGKHYKHARECTVFLSRCVTAVDLDRVPMFGRLFSQTKKHHTLALFSAVRLHKVQAMMNLRQVLEAGAAAAFAIANPEQHHFAETDATGILCSPQDLAKKRYTWLSKNYPKSEWIKDTKERINTSTAHANVISADRTFLVSDACAQIEVPFFDMEDDYTVQCDTWLISNVALNLMELFYGINVDRRVVTFVDGFQTFLGTMAEHNEALRSEIMSSDRFKLADGKFNIAHPAR